MFAVVKTGGKQYRVTEGDVIKVEKLDGETGKNITLDEVLMVGDDKSVKVGDPLIKGTSVTAEVLEQKKDTKITVFKKKRRHNYRRKKGHRQEITVLRVKAIGEAKKAAPKKAEAKAEEKAAPAKKETAKKAPAKKAAPKKAAAKTAEKKAPAKKAAAKKPAAKKTTKKTAE